MSVRRKKKKSGPKKTGPTINRGGSKQDYGTPRDFLDAVERKFGKIAFDLAAHKRNAVVPDFFSKRQDALKQRWHGLHSGILWLNPPFGTIPKWAKKCAWEAQLGAKILFLVPASVGSEWFYEHCHRKALVLPLRQRITFRGQTEPFMKDLMLVAYGFGKTGFQPWRWKEE